MKFMILCILIASSTFSVKGDLIKNLTIFARDATQKSLGYDQKLSNSLIQMLSNMKDLSTFSLFETWDSTRILFRHAKKIAETDEQKECIASERRNLSDIINGVAFPLFSCGRHALEFGSSIRKKVQDVHKASRKILSDSRTLEDFCSSTTDKRKDDCISFRIQELETSLKSLLQQLIAFQIKGSTIKLTALSNVLDCNAEVLTDINNDVINLHERLRKCVQ